MLHLRVPPHEFMRCAFCNDLGASMGSLFFHQPGSEFEEGVVGKLMEADRPAQRSQALQNQFLFLDAVRLKWGKAGIFTYDLHVYFR